MADDVLAVKDAAGVSKDVAGVRGPGGAFYQFLAQRCVVNLGSAVTVTDTETALTAADDEDVIGLIIVNNDDADTVYVGPTGLAASGTSNLGIPIPAGVEREIPTHARFYGRCATGISVQVLVYKLTAR